jgi:hypothetical protein
MITKLKIYQGKDYTVKNNPNRLNDYHMIWYLFGIPIRQFRIEGLDDWAKDNTFRGMVITNWNGNEQHLLK